jgi:translation initiation factor 2 beta subunit (eIF-2beta)/eIF-5
MSDQSDKNDPSPSTVSLAAKTNQNDPFYRYKRDKVSIKNKTIINWDTLCRQLKTPPASLASFLSKSLGCRVDVKGNLGKVLTSDSCDALVQTYVEKFVLCPVCHLPELIDKDDDRRSSICQSCGTRIKNK